MQDLLTALGAQTETLVQTLLAWCALESPSGDPAATSQMAAVLAAYLAARGAQVDVVPGGVHGAQVRATWPGPADRAPILLLGHHDTVHAHGSLARNPPRVTAGRAYGPGGYDMKAGLLLAAAAVAALEATGRPRSRPIILISSADEEIGSQDARPGIEQAARPAAAVLVLEPAAADGAVKTARKGNGMFTLVARGRAAHAGVDHAAGINAITELAHQVLALSALTDYGAGTTLNVGQIRGGTTINTVAAEAVAHVDVRATTLAHAAQISRQILALRPVLPGATLDVTGEFDRPPMERSPGTLRLFGLAQALGREIGLALRETATGGASDGNFTAALGVPTLDGLGACGDGAHTDHEYVQIADLAPRAALLAGLLTRI
ncbi:MAG TPA: M20 family metallopeptidase [Chloroflexia bacterium]|nr:M20 family metallopeptidase [Chloroflexia bacterium]